MKKVYLATIYIITIVCIVVGVGMHSIGWAGFNFLKPSNLQLEEYDEDLQNVGDTVTIKIDCTLGDVKIKKGDKFHLKYSAVVELETKVSVTENLISVTQKKATQTWGNNTGSKITLTVPEGCTIASLDVDNDLGDIEVSGVSFENGKVEESLGDIKIEDCKFIDLDVDNDIGDIKVLSCEGVKDYTIDAKVSLGEVKFFDDKSDDEYEKEGSNGTLIVKNSLGDITIR